jgi:single-stranded-DNA-specific exonuclease
MAARGLANHTDANTFIEAKLTALHDPRLIPDMDKAAVRILAALRAHDPVVIYGDYDVDGVTSTAILARMFRLLVPDAEIRTYVPHRLEEGYGLNAKAVETLAAEGARVIVSVDCGITAVHPAQVALRRGVDLIITDHHNPPASMDDLPAAFAVVHPRRPDSTYPFAELSGAGVAYKLAWRTAALAGDGERAAPAARALLVELLAFAALGAIADIVPLTGENRVIAKHGLARLKHSPFMGVRTLVDRAGLSGEKVSEWDVGFRLAPRLNACGRMGHAKEAVTLFTTEDSTLASAIADRLEDANIHRRAVEQAIVEQATAMAQTQGMTAPGQHAIVLAHPDWHAGVVGICCARLMERFGRPTILMQLETTGPHAGEAHGSGRAIEGYNLHAALTSCQEDLVKFGGHDRAAGLRVRAGRLKAFTKALIDHASASIPADQLTLSLTADTTASPGELQLPVVRQLMELRPFGPGNPSVKLLLAGVRVEAEPRRFGAQGQHLELLVGDGHRRIKLTAWRLGEQLAPGAPLASVLARGVKIDAVIEPKIDAYGGEHVTGELIDLRATQA